MSAIQTLGVLCRYLVEMYIYIHFFLCVVCLFVGWLVGWLIGRFDWLVGWLVVVFFFFFFHLPADGEI